MDNKESSYVNYVFDRKEIDNAFRANLKHAYSENLEWKAWNLIERFVDLNDTTKRKAYILIGSSISKSHQKNNGSIKFGKAMAIALKDSDKDELPTRFAKILSCSSVDDLIDALRTTITFVNSKGIELDYADLLTDILQFQYEDSRLKVKTKLASEFLSKENEDDSK